MSRKSYSTRELARCLRRLGFVEEPRRGKGSHRWFVFVLDGLKTRTMLPAERQDVPPKTYTVMLKQIRLHQSEFVQGCQGGLPTEEYAKLLRARRGDTDFKPRMD
jgi:predicted RNA binding protein YcfA (HicA-like mRNA interferase family)